MAGTYRKNANGKNTENYNLETAQLQEKEGKTEEKMNCRIKVKNRKEWRRITKLWAGMACLGLLLS